MAYEFYFDKELLPVAPSSLQLKFGNTNKTYTLINEGEINILKSPKLTEISFDVLIPSVQYGFAVYKDNIFKPSSYFLGVFEKLKTEKKPFQFIVNRTFPNGKILFGTNMKVSLEDYSIKEDVKEGFDLIVSIKLKQYRDFGTKTCNIQFASTRPVVSVNKTRATSNNAPKTGVNYTVKAGDCLWNIAKMYYGDGSKYPAINEANKDKIKTPNLIYPGQVLFIPDATTAIATTTTATTQKTSGTYKGSGGSKNNPPFAILSKSYSVIKTNISTWNEAYGYYTANGGSSKGWKIVDKDRYVIAT